MSGGHWDYLQRRIGNISEDLETLVKNNGKPKTKEELKEENWYHDYWYEKYPEEKIHTKESKEVIKIYKKAIKSLKIAEIYVQRIDWYLSGDDGEESLISRLKEDLDNLKLKNG